jgi:RNA polymerase sigma-70 factor (ECF subfamily)
MNHDQELMQRIQARDQQALDELYTQYGGAVYSLALRIVHDVQPAEELTQDIFMRVWEYPQKWDPHKGKLISWLLTVTRYAAIDWLRATQRRPDQRAAYIDEETTSGGRRYASPDWQSGHTMRALLNELPAEQRLVLELAFFGGMTHQDLADTLKLPLGTVKTRVRLGLQKLRQMWGEHAPTAERDQDS